MAVIQYTEWCSQVLVGEMGGVTKNSLKVFLVSKAFSKVTFAIVQFCVPVLMNVSEFRKIVQHAARMPSRS